MDSALFRSGRLRWRSAVRSQVARRTVSSLNSTWSRVAFSTLALWLFRTLLPSFSRAKRSKFSIREQVQHGTEMIDRAVLDVLPSHICILDENATIIAVNQAWRAFAKANPPVKANVCEGANYLAVCEASTDEPTGTAFASALRALIAGRLPHFSFEYPCHSPAEERWFTAKAYRYEHDGSVRVAITHEATTARKLAERSAEQSEERYHIIIEQALDGIYVMDRQGRFTMVNNAACIMTGYPRDELIGMHALQVLVPEDHPQFEVIWAKLMAGGIDQSEWCLIRKDGSRIDIEVRARMQSDGQVVGFARDVTERNEAQVLRIERDAAETASRAKDEFLAMLSHELRTPLAPVLMATRIIEQDEELPQNIRDLAATIHRNVELQARLIDDLLDQTRIARGKMELHRTKSTVTELISHVLKILEGEIKSKKLQVRMEEHATNPHIEGDVVRLQQILWNLIKNAVKFTPSHRAITIRTNNPTPDRVRIEVADTGIGIEPDLLPRLFKPFEQGNASMTRRFGGLGLGLGLAISEKLATLHRGTLTARSEGKDRGATFTLELPTVAAPRSGAPVHAPSSKESATRRGLRILIVEDHADTARVLARLLERHGHHVLIGNTLHEAEALAESEPLDLVLSDIDLPDGTGYDLMDFLRRTHPLPGIAMSGFGMEQDVRKSHEAGFSEHLVKPVDASRLEDAIEHLVAGTK
jgi:PAS domain S-box-containing protein